MRVVHISATDYSGGASRSAYRLHDGLRRLGLDSQMYVRIKLGRDPDVKLYEPRQDLRTRLTRTVRRFRLERAIRRYDKTSPHERTFFSQDRTMFYRDPLRSVPPSDLIQLHWVAEFLDYEAFFSWRPSKVPLVLTLHDMANFTGGCCYDMGCGKFVQKCGACPQLGSDDESDLTRRVWRRKQKYYESLNSDRVMVVTPSQWLGAEVSRSPLLSRFPRSVIPYGIDLDVFQPRDRRVAREVFRDTHGYAGTALHRRWHPRASQGLCFLVSSARRH